MAVCRFTVLTAACLLLVFLLLVGPPTLLQAETSVVSAEALIGKYSFPALEVKASRINKDPNVVPASFDVIPADDFDSRGVWYPGSELEGVPGLTVHNVNSGSNPLVTFRGIPNRINNDTFLVMVDGVPWLTTNDEVDFDQVPLVAVDHVEILRGTSTSIYGRGAVSGAINYVSRQPELTPSFESSLTFGSYGFRRLRILADLPIKEDVDQLALSLLSESKSGWRSHTRRERNSLTLRNNLKLGESAEFSLAVSGLTLTQGLAGELPVDRQGKRTPVPFGSRDNYTVDGAEYKVDSLAVTAQLAVELGHGLVAQSTLHWRNPSIETTNGFPQPYDAVTQTINWNGFHSDSDYWTGYFDQQVVAEVFGDRVLLGCSYEHCDGTITEDWTGEFDFDKLFYTQRRSAISGEWLNSDSWISDRLLDADSESKFAAIYGEWDHHLSNTITLKLGGRYDYFKRKVKYHATVNGFGPVPETTVRDDNEHFSSLVSLSWQPTEEFLTYVLYGEGFNPAFGPVWSFNSRNTSLDPEITQTYEIGLKSFWGRDRELNLNLATYLMQRHDLLVIVPGQGGGEQVNAGEQRSIGLEGSFSWRADRIIHGGVMFGSLQWIDSEWVDYEFSDIFTGQNYDFSDNQVAGIPEFAATLGWEQNLSSCYLKIRGEYRYQGDYWYDDMNTVKGGNYSTVNLALDWSPPWWPQASMQLVGTNIFNQDYWYTFGDPNGPMATAPGAPCEIMASLKLQW